jgi:hypothetical protein
MLSLFLKRGNCANKAVGVADRSYILSLDYRRR